MIDRFFTPIQLVTWAKTLLLTEEWDIVKDKWSKYLQKTDNAPSVFSLPVIGLFRYPEKRSYFVQLVLESRKERL